ncbi:MBL fold metallo-hydrolase [Halorarius halobius]|uniref:MBL fold metallo-hydrolase n=1 Tax=Halorarius halobius TaxID=2962671 RepID=UPI0020CF5A24|nr:MBL fold metallo-hydrolase [Halorarius halobius]
MARRLEDGLWQFDLGVFAPLAANVFLLDESERDDTDDDTVTLVDTGLPVNYPTVRSELTDAGYEVADIDRVLLTHYDLDHVGGLARLNGLDAEVYLGAADVALVRRDWDPQWAHHKGLFHRVARRFYPLEGYDLTPVEDGDRIGGFTAFHTPGHNPGHTVYVHEDIGTAFLGDLVWREGEGLTIPFWLDSYDMREIRRSVRGFADRTPAFERALLAHGDPIHDGGDDDLRSLADSLA